MEFIEKRIRGYAGSYRWEGEEVLGNRTNDSIISCLSFKIDFKLQLLYLSHKENLETREYQIYTHSSMDSDYDDGLDSTDRMLWASYRFESSYQLIQLIVQMNKIADFEFDKIKFKKDTYKSEFELATGIHLSESIITTSHRW